MDQTCGQPASERRTRHTLYLYKTQQDLTFSTNTQLEIASTELKKRMCWTIFNPFENHTWQNEEIRDIKSKKKKKKKCRHHTSIVQRGWTPCQWGVVTVWPVNGWSLAGQFEQIKVKQLSPGQQDVFSHCTSWNANSQIQHPYKVL